MRFIATALLLTCLAGATYAQRGGSAAVIIPRSIDGQIRLGERTAPTGVLVLLDIAPNRTTAASGSGEIGRTMTDSSGKFQFEHLEQIGRNGGKELFAVTVRYPGYQETFQIVDLTLSPRGYANIEMRRDTSRDIPNTPPSGAGNFVSARQPNSAEAQDALSKGQALLLEKHDPKASIESLKKLVKLDPQYGPGYVLLGTAYMQSNAFKDAETTFEQATKVEPTNPAAFLGMGASLNEQHDFAKAKDPLRHSLELKPDSPEAQYELARCYWALNDWQDAEGHVRKAIELNHDYPSAHVLMGNIYLRHRDANSALKEFKEFLRLEPEGPLAANVKEMVGKIEKALQQ